MKCIKYPDGTIKRVDDKDANIKVKSGDCIYVSKTEWKNQIYGLDLDDKLRTKYPANVEGSQEFINAMTKPKKEKKGKKTLEVPKKKEQPKATKKSSKK